MTLTFSTVNAVLSQYNIKVHIKNEGNFIQQMQSVGKELVSPNIDFIKKDLLKDQKVLTLAFIGLAPAFLITFTMESYLTFYAIALYFSLIWGAFFYFIFKTPQVDQRKAVAIFFIAQGAALVLSSLQLIPPMSYLYALTKSTSIIGQFIGFTLGVGVTRRIYQIASLVIYNPNSKRTTCSANSSILWSSFWHWVWCTRRCFLSNHYQYFLRI